jgi:hypothetical protein
VEALLTGGLIAPLSPPEEIALRRIAHGSLAVVDSKVASRLLALALIQRTSTGLRLTPLGRLRFDELPKAPLLAQQRSLHAMTGYVEGLIEKAQNRAVAQAAAAPAKTLATPTSPPILDPVSLLPQAQDEEDHLNELAIRQPVYFYFDCEQWKSRAERALLRSRQAMVEHRKRQESLCDASKRRIESSRLLLKESVPSRPTWL